MDTPSIRELAGSDLGVLSSLHEYQWEGVAFLYRSSVALLADEMGLGKTVQAAVALALVLQTQEDVNRALIVAPASLTNNWIRELSHWAPSLTVRRVSGSAQAREAYYLLPIPVLVASYEQIRSDGLDRVPPDTFDLVVLDEAQRIKNRDSATAFACRLLPRHRSWALTATPLENAETDVVSILNFLKPGLGPRLPTSRIDVELEAVMLRRRKAEVRGELPPVLVQDLIIDLSEEQRKVYDALWFERVDQIRDSTPHDIGSAILALITRLKILCNYDSATGASSKMDALQAFIEGAGSDARVIVFSQFVDTLYWIADRLAVPYHLLTGSMSADARDRAIVEFRQQASPRILLISLRAGGVGLNIGEATHVILFDRWWNPAVEVQAIYRAHRFERDMPLHVIRLLVQDTVEERIAQVLRRKEDLFEQVVESVDTKADRFTHEELLEILDVDPDELAQR